MPSKSFAELKKNRKTSLAKLQKKVQDLKDGNKSYKEDERFWSLERDRKTGNGHAVIRFLPSIDVEEGPWVKYFHHGFQGPGGWYFENSLTTLGQKDPVSEDNSRLWNIGDDDNKQIARDRKRRLTYISNILVVDDPANPENNGKVFLFKYGKKIHDKITEMINPEFGDTEPVDPFDPWEGANFKLRCKKAAGYLNYDSSAFDDPSPIADSDDEIESIWKSGYSLGEFLDPKNFKSYDELKAKFEQVVGYSMDNPEDVTAPVKTRRRSSNKAVKATAEEVEVDDESPWSDDDSDTEVDSELAAFEELAGE